MIKLNWDDAFITQETFKNYITLHDTICGIANVSVLPVVRTFDAYTESMFSHKLFICHRFFCENTPTRDNVVFCKNCNKTYCSENCREQELQRHAEYCTGQFGDKEVVLCSSGKVFDNLYTLIIFFWIHFYIFY